LPFRVGEIEIVEAEGVSAGMRGERVDILARDSQVENVELDDMARLMGGVVEILEFFVGTGCYLVIVVINV
jgi:hypothetical protein